MTIQAFHNDINLQNNPEKTLSRDPKTKLYYIATQADRLLIAKKFQPHIKEIFLQLNSCVQEKRFTDFFSSIAENVKNLAIRLGKQGVMDKKVEKAIKQGLLVEFEKPVLDWMQSKDAEGLPEGKIDAPQLVLQMKKVTAQVFNWFMILQGFYLGLTSEQVISEDWAVKLTAQVAIMTNEDKKELVESLIQNLYSEDG